MSAAELYPPRVIKRRSTKVEVTSRRIALYDIARRSTPATVRQIYYLATVAGLVPTRTDTDRQNRSDRHAEGWHSSLPLAR